MRDVGSMDDPEVTYGRFGNHAEIRYDDVRVPADHLIGPEGSGFLLAQARLGPGRIHHCMRWLGQSQRAFDMMCERALSRFTHGSLLAEKQTVQNWIADSRAEMHAARLMTLHAAWKMDQVGASASRDEIAMIKYYGATVLHNVIDRAHPGPRRARATPTDLPLEAMYRWARAARIYDGPDEVHRQTVARHALKDYDASRGARPSSSRRAATAAAREVRRRARVPRGRAGLARREPLDGVGEVDDRRARWPARASATPGLDVARDVFAARRRRSRG